jgi:riboflavin biosynthesis pyrimidine reductase
MMASVDGRIVTDRWPLSAEERREYELVHASYAPEGWLCGRVTMEAFANGLRPGADIAHVHVGGFREDYSAPGEFDSFAFVLDSSGRLAWETNAIGGDHLVALLSDHVSDDYLAFLRARGVSYVLAGTPELDLALALDNIGARFGVRTLLLEGGGRINGALLAAGLVDELSLLVAPAVDGRVGTPALVDFERAEAAPHRLALEAVERRTGDMLWIRYRVVRAARKNEG